MAVELKMPALSPTMEEGTLARWLKKPGDQVRSGDILAEIETDKATMEFEAVDEGTLTEILVPEGSEGVKVGTVIARIAEEGDAAASPAPATPPAPAPAPAPSAPANSAPQATSGATHAASTPIPTPTASGGGGAQERIKASPLARRIAAQRGIDLATVTGTGPNGRIVSADVEGTQTRAAAQPTTGGPAGNAAASGAPPASLSTPSPSAASPAPAIVSNTPHESVKLSSMRKTIARRLTEAKQTIPHIYLTVDVRLDALLRLRAELNASLSGRGVKLSVNDLLIKALARALTDVPECNVAFAGDALLKFGRADIAVAVSLPAGLITPIIVDAGNRSVSAISAEMKQLAERAKAGKLQPHEYQGGTASLSNMGMYGIKQFEAVINPPQAMIMAIGAGEKRPFIVDDAVAVATVMSATGSFDHRAIDGADGARLMQAFRALVETPLGLIA